MLFSYGTARRVGRAAGEVHPARAELHEEQDIHGLEEQRLDGEEVAGQELVSCLVTSSPGLFNHIVSPTAAPRSGVVADAEDTM
jgi:hypothetical protein